VPISTCHEVPAHHLTPNLTCSLRHGSLHATGGRPICRHVFAWERCNIRSSCWRRRRRCSVRAFTAMVDHIVPISLMIDGILSSPRPSFLAWLYSIMAARPVTLHAFDDSTSRSGVNADTKLTDLGGASSSRDSNDNVPLTDGTLEDNPFLDPKIAAHYRDTYESAQYECRHIFDPELRWTSQEERKLVRKLDLRVALPACFMCRLRHTGVQQLCSY
jgi:hypothetical protein